MKKHISYSICVFMVLGLLAPSVQAGAPGLWAAGARYHQEHSVYEGMPYGDGDFSYGIFYELYESQSILQLGVSYAPDVTGSTILTDSDDSDVEPVDQMFTPEINFLVRDGGWMFGVGMLMNYIELDEDVAVEEEEDEWSDLYWQLLFGYRLQLTYKLQANLMAYYPYEDWGDLGDIDFDDFDFGVQVVGRF